MTKRKVPIDRLVQWAYQTEIPKRDLSAGEGGTYGYARLIELGTRIDESDVAYQRYAGIGDPHPDAVAIEEAVAGLQDVVIDWNADARELLGPWFWMLEGERAHGYYYKAVRSCTLTVRSAPRVIGCAAQGITPYWHDEPPHCEPYLVKEGAAGRPSAVVLGGKKVEGRRGRRTWTWGSCCPIKRVPSATEIALDRAEYVGWWRALVSLRDALRGALSEHEPVALAVPERPWIEEPCKVTVFPVGQVTTRVLRLRPERAVAG